MNNEQKNPSGQGPEDNPFGEVIFSYSRAQAFADGVLVECTLPARIAGLRVPQNPGLGSVAMTVGALRSTVRDSAVMLDLVGVFAALVFAIRARRGPARSRVDFTVPGADGGSVDLYCLCGPGDDARPVLTVMRTDED